MSLKASIVIGGKSDDYERHENDFYPTPAECTLALVDFLKIDHSTTIWEPACGDGAISKVLINNYEVISTDIRIDSGYGIGGINFLNPNLKRYASHVITNPPFNLSVQFIEQCERFKLTMYALLLKSQYWHSSKRMKLFTSTRPAYVLPLTWRPNFAPNRGNAPTMDMAWTVWIRGMHETKYIPLNKPDLKEQLNLF